MTARFSLNSLPGRNMRSTVAENKKLMIVISILQLLGAPMIMLSLMLELWEESLMAYDYYPVLNTEMYVFIGFFCLGAAVLTGMIAATSVFQELWQRTKVDMLYSLPLTGSQRFTSHFLAGSIVYLVPYVIAVIIGWIVLIAGSFCIDFTSEFLATTRAEFLGEACKYYLLASLGLFLLMVLYYATTVLIVTCCGTLFESIYTTLLLNCLVPGTFAAVLGVICDNISGFSFEYLWQPIGYTSPVGGLIYLIYLLADAEMTFMEPDGWSVVGTQASGHGMIPAYIRWAIVITVIIAIVIAAAWYFYKRRLAESVSKPYVYSAVYYLMLTAVTVLILCLLNADIAGPALLMSAIFYFIMEVVRKRGFKKFWLSAITYGVTVALTIGFFASIIFTEAFGTVYRIPAASTVSSVAVDIGGLYGDDIQLEYTDKETIKAIQEIHRDIVSDMKKDGSTTEAFNERIRELDYVILCYGNEYDYGNYAQYYTIDPESLATEEEVWDAYIPNNSVWYSEKYGAMCDYAEDFYMEIIYYTHAGTTMHRSYRLNTDQYLNLLCTLYETDLFAEAAANRMETLLKDHYTVYDAYTDTYQEKDVISLTLANGQATQEQYAYNVDADIRKLRDAYYNDLKKMTAEDFLQSGLFGSLNDIPIWYACTETIELLRSYGFYDFSPSEVFNFPDIQNPYYFVDNYTQFSYEAVPLRVRIYAPGDYMGCGEEYQTYPSNYNYVKPDSELLDHTYFCYTNGDISELEPQLYALLSHLSPTYISKEPCYMIVIDGQWYAVPPEYESLVHEVVLCNAE